MNLFDKLVTKALQSTPQFSPLRNVVEKELLHHDILRIMRDHHLLSKLTFIGGTCLRYCYDGVRLSEDLDFTGGQDFSKKSLVSLGKVLTENLETKYGLHVKVAEPIKDVSNVDTWKVKIVTKPESKHLPAQHIHIDICSLNSYEVRPVMLKNPYGVDMGTGGLILSAQSQEEIFADKIIALALRPNRIKYRDLWDIIWLHQKGIKPNLELIPEKIKERKKKFSEFLSLFHQRKEKLHQNQVMLGEFEKEMSRFLPSQIVKKSLEQDRLWDFIFYLLGDFETEMRAGTPKGT